MSKRKTFRIVSIIVLSLGIILYLLADRYLIKHVEIADVVAAETTPEMIITAMSPTGTTAIEATTPSESAAALKNTTEIEPVIADDWNYKSGNLSISITEVSTDSGDDPLTYFVADVFLSDAVQLKSAFADNSFGRNIIAYTSEIATENDAIFAVNGDYYGFRTDGIEIRNGVIYRDEPARTGLAIYLDGSMEIYEETETSAQELLDAWVWNTLSFGPALVQDSVIVDNQGIVAIDTNIGNHTIEGENPRTGIGIIDNNHFIFVVVDGRDDGYSRGVTLAEFSQIFLDLGCTEAYNLDGGGSATMYFMGRVVNSPSSRNGERGTSDILFIKD